MRERQRDETETEKERELICWLTYQIHAVSVVARPKPGAEISIKISRMGSRDPSTGVVTVAAQAAHQQDAGVRRWRSKPRHCRVVPGMGAS